MTWADSAVLCREEVVTLRPHPRQDLPFSPMDLVLRYSLEQHAGLLGDAFETAAQHWQIEVFAEQFVGNGDDPVSWPVGWAPVGIAALTKRSDKRRHRSGPAASPVGQASTVNRASRPQ
jgi:hypothetical protein